MSGLSIRPAPGAAAPAPADERGRLAAAARQFEAIFIRQMLAAARQAGSGDALFGGGAGETFRAMQDERFAEIAADSGALGLARTIEQQLAGLVARQPPGADRDEG